MPRGGPRLFGHPVHALLTGPPVGLLATAPLWDLAALLRGDRQWWSLGFWTIALGTVLALPAGATGILEMAALPEGHPASGRATTHMTLMATAVALFVAGLVVRGGPDAVQGGARFAVATVDVVAALVLTAGGWFGGELVFRDGVGRTPG